MQIHVARPPAQLGVFSQEEVAAGLQDGRFLPSAQGWREGMSAWTPLSQWPEFASQAVPSAPASPAEVVAAPSQVPWEQGKSVGSFFATVKSALFSPRQAFANARMGIGDWLVFAYITQAIILPFRLLEVFVFEDPSAQLARSIEAMRIPQFGSFVESLNRQAMASEGMKGFKALGVLLGVGLVPLIVALLGVVIWLAYLFFLERVSLAKVVASALLAYSVVALLSVPVGLLGFNAILVMTAWTLFLIPAIWLYCRIQAAGLQRSGLESFGSLVLANLFCCTCLICGAMGLGFVFAAIR